jgi:hypothetical protein
MAMIGPQVGGVSLLIHVIVIIAFKLKAIYSRVRTGLKMTYQKIARLFRPNAK